MECISCYLGLQYQQETSQQVLCNMRWHAVKGCLLLWIRTTDKSMQREFGCGLMHLYFHLALNCSLVIFLFQSASV